MSEPAEVIPLTKRPHVLYRMYDAARQLLYVGLTTNIEDRIADHRGAKYWWARVATIELERFASRPAVEKAERAAIKTERPLFNVRHGYRAPERITSMTSGIGQMRHRNVRMDDETWMAASRIAQLRGERISDVVRNLVRGYVARNRKLLENDPEWQRRTADK